METKFDASFYKSLKAISDPTVKRRIKAVIEKTEAATSIKDLANVKKLKGGTNHYRIRIADYRIGFVIENNTVIFIEVGHRREFYRYFP